MEHYDQLFVGGEWVPPTDGSTLTVTSPATGEPVGRVATPGPADVDRAVAAAREAFDRGPWPHMAPAERAAAVAGLGAALAARADDLTHILALEVGTPVSAARGAQVDTALEVFDYYAELGRTLPAVEHPVAGRHSPLLVRTEPVGVVAAITPWNVPLYITALKLAPALLAGCTVVVKAAPETPLHAHRLAEAAAEVGLPPGVLSIVAADREVSEHLVSHPGVDKVAFTGSTATGRRIAAICGGQLKRVTLELGGKSAAIVLPDADLDVAVPTLVLLNMALSGQICIAQSRVLVPRRLAGEVADRARAVVESLTVGDPFDEGVFMGPLISRRQRERVLGYVTAGREEGATLLTGGGVPAHLPRGWFVEPTVFVDVDNGMRIAREEIFGPVMSVIAYDSEEEAIAIAGDSPYGLHGSVWTADTEHGADIGRRIRTGTFSVNGMALDPAGPFGGMKASGIGRELGPQGLAAYQEYKTISLPA
jgi:acyl-CoA reductase-like NAD-dependent aldehyde dehydrogenase